MKILVVSDSHGHANRLGWLVEEVQPNCILHLGDGARDADQVRSQYPQIPLFSVAGNCDIGSSAPAQQLIELEGVRMFLAHGHFYGVKQGRDAFIQAARSAGAHIALYGHTHVAEARELPDGMWLMNPGSAQPWDRTSYGIIMLENGTISCYTVPI